MRFSVRLALRSSDFGTAGTGFANILHFISLPTPEYAVHRGGGERALTECFQVTEGCLGRMLQQSMLDGRTVQSRVQEVVDLLLQSGTPVANGSVSVEGGLRVTDSCLQIPVGLCFLIKSSCWRTLALAHNSKWDVGCDALPLLQEVRAAASTCELKGYSLQTFLAATELQPVHQLFNRLADDLCEWGRAIVAGSADPQATTADLEQYVIWLNSMREATVKKRILEHAWESIGRGSVGRFNKISQSHGRYRAIFLIQCVLLAFHLKSSSTLGMALQRAFALLPEIWSKTLSECFSVEVLPSGATISRARLYLDAAYMLYMREEHERLLQGGACFYALMDSSPQGFQNWLMSETFLVKGQQLLQVLQVFFDLALSSQRLSEGADPLNVEALEDILERTDFMKRCMQHHTFPPTALGVRQTTLSHKVHAFLHSLRLEHSTWSQLQAFLDNTFAYTSDMGTEASFNLTTVDVPSYFPYWPDPGSNSHLSLDFQDADQAEEPVDAIDAALELLDDGGGPEAAAQVVECRSLDLSKSLFVPGMFHVIDNATKDVLKKSSLWSQSLKGMLESVLLFFNAFHRRKWFMVKCLGGRLQAFSEFFQSAPPKLEGGRAWGVVSTGVAWVLERQVMLQQAWSAESLLSSAAPQDAQAQGDQRQQQQESTKLVTSVDEAIRSPIFWAFLNVCSCITHILDKITSWTQGCACHGYEMRQQLEPLLAGRGPLSCPMRGRRAPEIAEGALHRFIDGLFQYNDSQILMVHAAGLEQEAKTQLLLDWSAMKVHMRMQFDLKLSPWRQLPLSALALGHWDISVARRMMWDCMVEWENLTEEQQTAAHHHSRKLFVTYRQEALSFIRGEAEAAWPNLVHVRAQSAFVPILEQSIERRHALLHQHLRGAPHHSAPYVSLCERKDEILDLLSVEARGRQAAEHLAELCCFTRTPPQVAQALGLASHEEFSAFVCADSGELSVGIPHCFVASVVYRCDLRTQYKSLPLVHKKPYNPWFLPAQGGLAMLEDAHLEGPQQGDASREEQQAESASSEHLQKMLGFHAWAHVAAASSQEFFSLTPSQALPVNADQLLQPLADAVFPGHRKLPLSLLDGPKDIVIDMDFGDDSGVPNSGSSNLALAVLPGQESANVVAEEPSSSSNSPAPPNPVAPLTRPVMFRVVSGTPGQKKLARTDNALEIGGQHIAVERCVIHELDYPNRQVSVRVSAGHCQSELLQTPASFQSCLSWQVLRSKASFIDAKLSPEEEVVLDELLKARGAGAGGENKFQLSVHSQNYEAHLAGLQALKAGGFVDQYEGGLDDVSGWALSAKGVASLCQVVVLHNSASLLSMPAGRSERRDIDKMTILELMHKLRDAGFQLEVRSKDLRAEPLAFNLSTGRPKKWYVKDRSMEVCRQYILALLDPDTLRKNGHEQVRHLQKASYYQELFGAARKHGSRSRKGKSLLMLSDEGTADPMPMPLEDVRVAAKAKAAPKRRAAQPLQDAANSGGALALADAAAAGVDDDAGQASRARRVHPKSFRWGALMLTFKSPGSYQATCPRVCTHRHTAGHQTACTKTRSFEQGNAEAEALVIRELKYWGCQAFQFPSRGAHMKNCRFQSPPEDAELEGMKIPSDYETADEELRPVVKRRRRGKQADSEVPEPKAKSKASGGPKAKSKAGVKSKAKAAASSARGSANSASSQPNGSGSNSSGSSDSSSSSDSGSSKDSSSSSSSSSD